MEGTELEINLKHIRNIAIWARYSLPVVANMMLAVLAPEENGLELWRVIVEPPVEVEVRLRTL